MNKWFYFLMLLSFLFTQCNDTTIVGSSIFDEEELSLRSIDTLDIIASTSALDSVRVFALDNSSIQTFLIGELDDPFLGTMKSSLVTEVHYAVDLLTGQIAIPDYEEGDVLDSMVLILQVNPQSFYGDTESTFDLKVFQLTESLNEELEISTNDEFSFDPVPIAELNDVTIPKDSIVVFLPSEGTSTMESAQVRIPFGDEVSNLIFNDLRTLTSNPDFVNAFPGIRIEATPTSGNSIFGVSIANNQFNSTIQAYYKRDTLARLFEYVLNDLTLNVPLGRKFSQFESDVEASPIGPFLENTSAGDSLLFIQGMLGTSVELDLSSILELEDVLINLAILELTVAQLPGEDFDVTPPLESLVISTLDENGNLVLFSEITEGLLFDQLDLRFGGTLEEVEDENTTVFRYSMDITRSLIEIFNGDLPSTLFITPLSTAEQPGRTILYGPGHSTFPLKLQLSVTSI
jgi:hypothetical protein